MNSVQPKLRRSPVLLLLAILTLSSSFIIYGQNGTGAVFFMLRDQALLAGILVHSAALWYAWWRGAGPKPAKS